MCCCKLILVGLLFLGLSGFAFGAPCTCGTPDVAPDEVYTCQQQASFGACFQDWMTSDGWCCQSCRFDIPEYCVGDENKGVQSYLNYTLIGNVGSAAEVFADVVVAEDVFTAANALQRAIALDIRTASRATAEAMEKAPKKVAQVLTIVLGYGNSEIDDSFVGSLATASARYYTKSVAEALFQSSNGGYSQLVSEAIKTAARMHSRSAAESLSEVVALGIANSTAVVNALSDAVGEKNNFTLEAAAETIAIVSENSGAELGAYLINNILLKGGEILLKYLSEKIVGRQCIAVGEALSKALDSSATKDELSTAISKLIAQAPCLKGCCGAIQPAVIAPPAVDVPGIETTPVTSATNGQPEPATNGQPEPAVVDTVQTIQDISSVVVPCPRLRCSRLSGNCCNGQPSVLGDSCVGIARREYKFIGVCKVRGQDAAVVSPTSRGQDCYCEPQ
eukprot:TRINITY_DN4965_c2_g4_i1.p1 TRINITY_DN4965_c2_g4~~TRINITY_DN4965_c2_g4_i1.p1  ORF type:complete len:490 (-),score=83.22 TRINITY_DN4965_c2_g4_i1:566-1912(-)